MAQRVLIADDIQYVRETLSKIVTAAHYQVVGEASTGYEAMMTYARTRPDIVLMDLVMPEMGGIEATKEIVKKFREANIVIISALEHENLIADAINAGAKDFIVKPFSKEDILKTIEHVLKGGERSARQSI